VGTSPTAYRRINRPGPPGTRQNTASNLAEIQRTLATRPPYINLWYFDNCWSLQTSAQAYANSPATRFLKTAELDESGRQSVIISRQEEQ